MLLESRIIESSYGFRDLLIVTDTDYSTAVSVPQTHGTYPHCRTEKAGRPFIAINGICPSQASQSQAPDEGSPQ